jgi:methylated-DNA-[protein]-cysteine S-methyltransferase
VPADGVGRPVLSEAAPIVSGMPTRTATATRYACAELPSPVGPLGVAVTDAGLVALAFGGAGHADRAARRLPGAAPGPSHALLDQVRRELREYFAGDRTAFEVPVDWRLSTGFARRALVELHASVGYGETIGYGALAGRLTDPAEPAHDAARAVGRAMAGNPVAVVVPCHRVLASTGDLHGFGGGLEAKRRLLALEGVLPRTFDDLLAFG